MAFFFLIFLLHPKWKLMDTDITFESGKFCLRSHRNKPVLPLVESRGTTLIILISLIMQPLIFGNFIVLADVLRINLFQVLFLL